MKTEAQRKIGLGMLKQLAYQREALLRDLERNPADSPDEAVRYARRHAETTLRRNDERTAKIATDLGL